MKIYEIVSKDKIIKFYKLLEFSIFTLYLYDPNILYKLKAGIFAKLEVLQLHGSSCCFVAY